MKKSRVEILAPAGSYESMTAAVNAGADAVYIGGNKFGARAFANNLDEAAMLNAIDYVHLHNCRLYMTVNTLFKENELNCLFDYLNPFYKQGLDAVIVQDLGAFMFIKEHFPGLPIHASTQMTVTGVYGAKKLEQMGAERIVTARELSLEEIKEIRDNTNVEIESFVHGALCYCYSGQCLLSSLIGGRSGNRGRCAQPCRLPYDIKKDGRVLNKKDEKYVLSLKDMCTLDIIPDMLENGVYSMKIEGRMKSPRYTAGVVSIYRKYVDMYLKNGRASYRVDDKDRKILLDLFDRGGFTEGYYRQHNGKDMIAVREKPSFREGNQELFDYLDKTFVNTKKQEPIKGIAVLNEGEPAFFSATWNGITAEYTGENVQTAINQPVTEEKVKKQLEKTGTSPYKFEELLISVSGNIFMPVQSLNDIRRNGLNMLQEKVLSEYRRSDGIYKEQGNTEKVIRDSDNKISVSVLLHERRALEAVLGKPCVSRLYIEAAEFEADEWKNIIDECHKRDMECMLAMPYIFRTEAVNYFKSVLDKLKRAEFDGLLIRSIEETEFLKENDISLKMVYDSGMYTFNTLAEKAMKDMGADQTTFPIELNSRELESLYGGQQEIIGYGYIPAMVTAQCIKRTSSLCDRQPELLWLKDRMGKELPVKNQCRFCCNIIYNSSPLSLLGNMKTVKRLKPASVRLQFTIENISEIDNIITAFEESLINDNDADLLKDFTRGHFRRGVE